MNRELVLTVSLLAAGHLVWVFRAIVRDMDEASGARPDPYPTWLIAANAFACIGAYAFLWYGFSTIVLWVFR